MSERDQGPGQKGPDGQEPNYEVGYGKPPAKTQFRKGQSGNPGGRPKGARNKSVLGLNEERRKSVILEEAYRPVVIREGDHVVEMPVIQVVIRSMAAKAAKGDHRSQTKFNEMVQSVEHENSQDHIELFTALTEHKINWEQKLARRAQTGETGPQPFPHPDDIVVYPQTAEVEIRGPITKEEEVDWEEDLDIFESRVKFIEQLKEMIQDQPKNQALRQALARHRRLNAKLGERVGHYAARKQEEERRRKEADPNANEDPDR